MSIPSLPIQPEIPADILLAGLARVMPNVDWTGLDFWEVDGDGNRKKRLTTVSVFATGTMKSPEEIHDAPLAFDDEIDRAIHSSGIDDDDDEA